MSLALSCVLFGSDPVVTKPDARPTSFDVECKMFSYSAGKRPKHFQATRVIGRPSFQAYALQPTDWDTYTKRLEELSGTAARAFRLAVPNGETVTAQVGKAQQSEYYESKVTTTSSNGAWLYLRAFKPVMMENIEVGRETLWELTLPITIGDLMVILPTDTKNGEKLYAVRANLPVQAPADTIDAPTGGETKPQ